MKNIIAYLEERNFIDEMSSPELREIVNKPISLYLGIDPSAPSPHLGNFVGMIALMHFQKHGHRPVILLGGATGLIGDPSGKSKERPLLTGEEVAANVASIKKILARFLDFDHPTAAPIFVNNHDWFSQMSVLDFLRDVGKHFRMGAMLGKDSVRTRLASEDGMSFTEFSYQTLQGYDFYHLHKNCEVSLQIGGSDQYGNITAGIEYTRRVEGKSVYGLAFPLLTRGDGKKFGKSEEGAIWLDENLLSPFQFYQYMVRMPDNSVIRMMEMLTTMEIAEIRSMEKAMQSSDYEANTAQKKLAEEVTRLVHGEEGLQKALKTTEITKPGTLSFNEDNLLEVIENMPHTTLQKDEVLSASYVDVVVKAGLISSKGEAKRLIKNQGAYLNGEKVLDVELKLSHEHLLKNDCLVVSSGKKKTLLIKLV